MSIEPLQADGSFVCQIHHLPMLEGCVLGKQRLPTCVGAERGKEQESREHSAECLLPFPARSPKHGLESVHEDRQTIDPPQR